MTAIVLTSFLGTGYAQDPQTCLQPAERDNGIQFFENRCAHNVNFVYSATREACLAGRNGKSFPCEGLVIGNGTTDVQGHGTFEWHECKSPDTPSEQANGSVECQNQ